MRGKEIRLVIVAYQFPPLIVGGSERPFMFAKYLANNDFDVTVLTLSQQSYSKVYQKANIDLALLQDLPEEVKIISVESEDLIKARKGSIPLKFPEFFNEAYFWRKEFFNSIERIKKENGIDLILVTAPPFCVANQVIKYAKKEGIPCVFDMRDHWTFWVTTPYKTFLHFWWTKRMENRALKTASKIITTSEVTRSDLLKLHRNLNPKKLLVIPNGFDATYQKANIVFSPNNKINIGYIGSFYYDPDSRQNILKSRKEKSGIKKLQYVPRQEDWLYRSPYFFLKTINTILSENPSLKSQIQINFAGQKPSWLEEMVASFNLESNVNYLGLISKSESIKFLKRNDFLLITSSKIKNGKDYSIAGKTFDYLQSQKPILAFVTNSAQRDLLIKTGAAIILNPDNNQEAVKKLTEIFSKGVTLSPNVEYISTFERKVQVKNLGQELKTCIT